MVEMSSSDVNVESWGQKIVGTGVDVVVVDWAEINGGNCGEDEKMRIQKMIIIEEDKNIDDDDDNIFKILEKKTNR